MHSKLKMMISGFLHTIGILIVFCLFVMCFVSTGTGRIIFGLMDDAHVSSEIITPLLTIFGLSTLVWLSLFFIFKSMTRSNVRTLKRARGTIMTETLIVIPIFLLFMGGIAQMGINSMAGLLTTVGAFEAGRLIAAWGPEIGKTRIDGSTITEAIVSNQARISAAAIVTPVARDAFQDFCDGDDPAFVKFRKGMGASLSPIFFNAEASPPALGSKLIYDSYNDSFGSKSFLVRGPAKMLSAYCSTSIEADFENIPNSGKNGADFSVTVTYKHHPVFPLVRKIFENTEIKRKYTMRSHLPPNDALPEQQ